MMSIADIAARDGVSKPTISNHVKRLVERNGLAVERDGRGRVAAVNVAQYDHLRARYADPARAQAPAKPQPTTIESDASSPLPLTVPKNESLDEAQRQRAWIEAERAKMRLAEEAAQLVSVDAVRDATRDAGIEIVRVINTLVLRADDFAAAVSRDGVHGLRVALKACAAEQCTAIAKALASAASAEPEMVQIEDDPAAQIAPVDEAA